MIEKGRDRGHKIKIITPQNINLRNIKADLTIISNCVTFPRETLLKICEQQPYVIFVHDFYFCKYRLYFPMLDKCKECINHDFWHGIFRGSKLNIFLSPLHYEAHKFVFSEEVLQPRAIIPSAVNTELYRQIEGIERKKDTVLGINALEVFKARYNTYEHMKANPHFNYTIIGTAPECSATNVKYIPYVSSEELVKLYNECEYFIALNATTEPFGRVCAEALLCGMKIIKNQNIGFFSYNWNYKNIEEIRNYLRQASDGFWEEIEKISK